MAKKALTEADIAALAAGVPIQASSTPIPVVAEETLVIEGVQDGVQTKKGRREEEVIPAPTVDAKAEQSSVAPEFATLQATVQLLSQQLAAKEALLLEAAVKANRLDEQLVEAKAVAGPMLDIVAQSLSNMRVAMGGSTFSLNGTSAAQVLAEHQRVAEQFKNQFKVGGVAAVSGTAEATKEKEQYVMTNVTQAQLNAIRGYI